MEKTKNRKLAYLFVIASVLAIFWYVPLLTLSPRKDGWLRSDIPIHLFSYQVDPKRSFSICKDDPRLPDTRNSECYDNNTISFGTITPKCSSNFVDDAIVDVFGLKSCNIENRKKQRDELSNAIYCFRKRDKPGLEKDFKSIFPKLCNYVGSHVDYGITEISMPKGVKCVRRYTMLRHPVKRLRSAIKYGGGKSVNFIRENLLYAGDNHMTRLVAGQSQLCRTLPKIENKTDILKVAKYNLQYRYDWFGVVEMMDESMALLGYHGNSSNIVQPAQASSKGLSNLTDEQILSQRQHFELDLELYDFAVKLLKYFFLYFVKRGGFDVDKDDWKEGYHYIHVKDVFRKHIVAKEKEKLSNVLSEEPPIQMKILNFIKSKAYDIKPGFQYSTRVMIATFIGMLAVYLILIQLVSYGYVIFTKTWNQILNEERLIWLADNLDLPVPLIKKHVDWLQACWWLAMFFATILYILTVLNSLVWYRRHVLMLRRGDRSFLPSSIKKGSLNAGDLMTASFKFAGFQVGYSAWGYLIKHVVLWLVFSFLSVFFFVPLFHGGPSFLLTMIKGYWPSVIVALIAVFVQNGLARGFFLLNKENVSVDNRRGFHITSYVLFYFNVFIGVASCLLRIAFGAILGVVLLSRLQKSTLPRSYERRDPGYLAYLGFLMVEHQHSNPVLHCFVRILLEQIHQSLQQDEFTVVRRKTKVLLKTYDTVDNGEWGVNGRPLTSSSKRRTVQDISRSARIRWFLAVTLIQNPSIRKYRGHYIRRRRVAVKNLTRALFQINLTDNLQKESEIDLEGVRSASIGYHYRESPRLKRSERLKQLLRMERFCDCEECVRDKEGTSSSPIESSTESRQCKISENYWRFLKYLKTRERSHSNGSSDSSNGQKDKSLEIKNTTNDEITEISENHESANSPQVKLVISPNTPLTEGRIEEFDFEMEEVRSPSNSDIFDEKTRQDLGVWI